MNTKKKIREHFRNSVFERDVHKCVMCGTLSFKATSMYSVILRVELDAHHITDRNEMPNGGYVKENGISLCPECHKKAELYHTSNKTVWHPGFHPNDLYAKIHSSYEISTEMSENA